MYTINGANYFTDKEFRQGAKEMTNRQLLRDYRLSVIHLAELEEKKASGWDTYLGDNIIGRISQEKKSLRATENELVARGYDLSKIVIK